jgi:uncharacterized membrane protein YheB (UPF0754 family)
MKKLLKFIRKVGSVVLILFVFGGGWFYYKYRKEKLNRLAEEEKRRQEEMEKERQKRLIEEKRKLFEEYVSKIRNYKESKDYEKVRELAKEALAIAKQYNFSPDEINKILHQMEVEIYLSKLKKLENEDAYKYIYVRDQAEKIPSLKEISDLKNRVIKKTYEDEYEVKLFITKLELSVPKKIIDEGEKVDEVSYNYFLSKKLSTDLKKLRIDKNIKKNNIEIEIEKNRNDLYFSSENLYQNTIPSSLY